MKVRCAVCREDYEPREHRHCKSCGCPINVGQKTVHGALCRGNVKLKAGQECPVCHRLLAAGAFCPSHGNPLDPTPF